MKKKLLAMATSIIYAVSMIPISSFSKKAFSYDNDTNTSENIGKTYTFDWTLLPSIKADKIIVYNTIPIFLQRRKL